jgi:hypothetical protein
MATICAFLAKPNSMSKTLLPQRRDKLIGKEDNTWEVVQLINGDIFIYHKGFKEEASMEDVFEYSSEIINKCSCFKTKGLTPIENSTVRLNRAVIAFAWYLDPNSSVVQGIKKIISEQ